MRAARRFRGRGRRCGGRRSHVEPRRRGRRLLAGQRASRRSWLRAGRRLRQRQGPRCTTHLASHSGVKLCATAAARCGYLAAAGRGCNGRGHEFACWWQLLVTAVQPARLVLWHSRKTVPQMRRAAACMCTSGASLTCMGNLGGGGRRGAARCRRHCIAERIETVTMDPMSAPACIAHGMPYLHTVLHSS